MKLSLIIFWRKFSVVLFAYLIKEDVRNVLLLLARKHRSTGMILSPLIHSRGFDAWSFTFGLHWSWSKNHRRLLARCSAGTTSSTCYLRQRLLDVWAELSKDHWRPNVNDQASKPQLTNTIKDLLKFAIVRNSHFKHSYLIIYWIKCYGTLESYCWFNSLNIWKVLVWYDQA